MKCRLRSTVAFSLSFSFRIRPRIGAETSGARLAGGSTVAVKVWAAVRPAGSAAVTVTSAMPALTAVMVTMLPAMATVTTRASLEAAVKDRGAPSGSVKCRVRSTVAVSFSFSLRDWSGIGAEVCGARLGGGSVVTRKVWVAVNPAGSAAVTVTSAMPALTAVMVTVLPATATVTTRASLETASKLSGSPSGSAK